MNDEATQFASFNRASVVAAAGCGKTELIANAVVASAGRQLVITHTNAGVEAIRRRLRHRKVSNERVAVDTLDGWCLKYVASYPVLSGGLQYKEDESLDWAALRSSMCALLDIPTIIRVLGASYAGVFVDEYQDCLDEQHRLVEKIATLLPVRIVGDPLQAVFGFGANVLVQWHDVEAAFPPKFQLRTPWRWKKVCSDLGDWPSEVRSRFEALSQVELAGDPRITHVKLKLSHQWEESARETCFRVADKGGTVAAICKWPGDQRTLARMTGGLFQCVEPIEAKDAGRFLDQLERLQGLGRAELMVGFLRTVATKIDAYGEKLCSTLSSEVEITGETREAARRLRSACSVDSASAVADALESCANLPGVRVYRRELLWAVLDTLRDVGSRPAFGLREALRRRRNSTSHIGRRLSRCTVGTVLLLKGLEFDHAVVIHRGGSNGFTVNELYVAITRGAKSLTVISVEDHIDLRELPVH